MSDLISRDALMHEILYGENKPEFCDGQDVANWQYECITNAPVMDTGPIVHCSECKYHSLANNVYVCNHHAIINLKIGKEWTIHGYGIAMGLDDYCSYGKCKEREIK